MEDDIYFRDAFPTLFLPMEVPSCPLLESDGRDENTSVLQCLSDFLASDNLSDSSFSHLKAVAERFVFLHKNGQKKNQNEGDPINLCDRALKKSLEETPVSEYWGLWIREQNAALLVHRLDIHNALLLVWEVQCSNRDVTGNRCAPQQVLPRCGMKVSWERLCNSSDLLTDLVSRPQELARPVTRKAGEDFHESRDVNDPLFALDILPCALGGEALKPEESSLVGSSTDSTVPLLKKMMRDEVRYSSSLYPWRRAPIWAALKGILNIVDCHIGKNGETYKAFVQLFLAFVLDKVASKAQAILGENVSGKAISLSSLTEACRKLQRRLEKMTAPNRLGCVSATGSAIRTAMEMVKQSEDNQGIQHALSYQRVSLQEFVPDTVHKMPKSKEILGNLVRIADTEKGDITAGSSQEEYQLRQRLCKRLREWSALDAEQVDKQTSLLRHSIKKFGISPQDFMGVFHDISEGVMDAFQDENKSCKGFEPDSNKLSSALHNLLLVLIEACLIGSQHTEVGTPFEGDVRGKSQAILVAVTLCLLLDQIACIDFPLLRDHKLGVSGVSPRLETLFLPTTRLKKHLNAIEMYIEERERASFPAVLSGSSSSESFSARFVENSAEMKETMRQIDHECSTNQTKKKNEATAKMREHDELLTYVRRNPCSCRWESNGYRTWRVDCAKCSKEEAAKNITVNVYVKLLPEDPSHRSSVVYNLMIPCTLECQRDCWLTFASLVCKENLIETVDWSRLWKNSLHNWTNSSSQGKITLGSTRKNVADSHYRACHVTDLLASKLFVVENDCNLVHMDDCARPIVNIQQWKWNMTRHTTLKVQEGRYANLEDPYYNSWMHSENEIIAFKSEASEELSLGEFEAVGKLRAGAGLQIFRLADGIHQRLFSLDREEIVSLFCCVLWQAGPRYNQSWFRKCWKSPLKSQSSYVPDMCRVLGGVLDGISQNWANQNALLNVLYIARTLLDHSLASNQQKGIIKSCSGILLRCRSISYKWIASLMETSNGCTDEKKMLLFQKKMADIAAMGSLSFFQHDEVFSSANHMADWTFFRAVFHDNTSPNQMLRVSWRRPHLLHAMAVAEEMAPRISNLAEINKLQGLDMFLKRYWMDPKTGQFEQRWSSSCPGWYNARFRRGAADGNQVCILEVHTISGAFLVNGSPCARLPKEITAHQAYRQYFGDAMFLVQPQGSGGYRTKVEVHNGCHYEFFCADFNPTIDLQGAPLIVQVRARADSDEARALLVPKSIVEGDVPKLLSTKYSHWFLLTSNRRPELHFRPPEYTDPRIQENWSEDEYVMYFSSWKLHDKKRQTVLVDNHSQSFKTFHNEVFQRLSPAEYMHVSVAAVGGSLAVDIHLPRLNLRFDYKEGGLVSREYNLPVADEQALGTLYGLRHGLLLEDPDQVANSLFLCPHGRVVRDHHSVEIDTGDLASPPLFKYEVLPELRSLRGKSLIRLEWLFLAFLHAQTGRLQHDPFLGCTGTEKALRLLRSPYCTGDLLTSMDAADLKSQYKPEMDLLCEIARISPSRKDYHSMEMCTLGRRPALCAHPALAFLASRRILDIKTALKQIGREKVFSHTAMDWSCYTGSLSDRAYFFRRQFYSRDERLTQDEEVAISSCKSVSPVNYNPPQSKFGDSIRVPRFLGHISQSGDVTINGRASLYDLLCNEEELYGRDPPNMRLTGFSSTCFDALSSKGIVSDKESKFADKWINLYVLARQVKADCAKSYTDYCNLLVWVGAMHPNFRQQLCQLMAVAKYAGSFPPAPDHTKYEKTDESEFDSGQVAVEIKTCLEDFTDLKPALSYRASDAECRRYERDLERWEGKKAAHEESRKAIEAQLKAMFETFYHHGRSITPDNVRLNKVSSPDTLASAIQGLFERWRKAKTLKDFLEKVHDILETLQSSRTLPYLPRDTDAPPIYRSDTTKTHVAKVDMSLGSRRELPDLIRTGRAADFRRMARTGSFRGAFRYKCNVKSCNIEKFPDIESAWIDENPQYEPLYTKMLGELKTSLKLASTQENDSFEDFCNPLKVSKIREGLNKYKTSAQKLMDDTWVLIEKELLETALFKDIVGLCDSVTPEKVLSVFFQTSPREESTNCKGKISFTELCLAFALCMKHVQRARRCLRHLSQAGAKLPYLARDLESTGCEGWTPMEFPEFLGFEVDNDINIRGIQAKVAIEILSEEHGNRLLQLNMGQGKTAVIMPLVLCAAARGDKIVRATVLPSLFSTNTADWQHKLGGLLGRRAYTFCCRRDLKLGEEQVQPMLSALKSIKSGKHFIVTVPEHRLSLENKALDLCSAASNQPNPSAGMLLLKFMEELAFQGREFLDESDEILSPLYQLIYTLGAPRDMDGGMLRWIITAAVLQSVQRNAKEMVELYPLACTYQGKSNKWLRLLQSDQSEKVYTHLCDLIVDDFLKEKVLPLRGFNLKMYPKELDVWKCFVLGGDGLLSKIEGLAEKEKTSALVLRGILSHEVLKLWLQKRYRVDYGQHPIRKGYDMAVPYRAKDVAAETTEFGHPDMALGLTFSSYYQSGLREPQLHQVFDRLLQMNEAKAKTIYRDWVQELDVSNQEGITEFEGVNLQDPILFEKMLFPAFSCNKGCIDFYLTKLVLPVQAKQFPQKIVATAGDLCRSPEVGSGGAVTTGFSGTDDLQYAFPTTVIQKNLDELKGTNGLQLRAICQPRNNRYHALKPEAESQSSTDQLLELLSTLEKESNVVLDSGALVLHKDNAGFSTTWLNLRLDMEACVFFDGDTVFYVTRDGRRHPFQGSPHVDDMSKCLLYLDDAHTRGSDFLLPLKTRAVLTLGKGMTKYKFVQACMRMRQLQNSQSLTFVSMHEVDMQLKMTKSSFAPDVILNWTIANTITRICDLFPYLANQTILTAKKAQAFQSLYYESDNFNPEKAKKLAAACIEDEILLLEDMYGHDRDTLKLPAIVERKLKACPDVAGTKASKRLQRRIADFAPHVKRACSLFDEEQERELENELEEERQAERPPPAEPVRSKVSDELRLLLLETKRRCRHHNVSSRFRKMGFLPLGDIFKETSMQDFRYVFESMFCTSDFAQTVKGSCEKDYYVKRPQWIVNIAGQGANADDVHSPLVLISNFEAEFFSHLLGQEIFLFSPIMRLGQSETVLRGVSAAAVPSSIHVFGGSLCADSQLMRRIREFLALYPSTEEGWEEVFHQGLISRDGFVPKGHRQKVDPRLCRSPFILSPVSLLVRFLSNTRHVADELPNSPLGRLLGVCDIDGYQ